jgi:tetratricopeptide (TPR) repeat protein
VIFVVSSFCVEDSAHLAQLYKYVKSHPDDLRRMYELSVELVKVKRECRAIPFLSHLAKSVPSEEKFRFLLARCWFKCAREDESLLLCDTLKDPRFNAGCKSMRSKLQGNPRFTLYKVRKEIDKGEIQAARSILNGLLVSDSDIPDYRLQLARILFKEGEYASASIHFFYAKDRLRGHEDVKSLGEALEAQGETYLKWLNEQKTDIKDFEAFYGRLVDTLLIKPEEASRRLRGFLRDGAEYYQKQVKILKSNYYTYYRRIGILLMMYQEAKEARVFFKKAMEEAPNDMLWKEVDYLMNRLEKYGQKDQTVLDLIERAGGYEKYKNLTGIGKPKTEEQKVDEKKAEVVEGLDKKQFVQDFVAFRAAMKNADDADEKRRLKKEFENKYKSIFEDGDTRAAVQEFLNSKEGKQMRKEAKEE